MRYQLGLIGYPVKHSLSPWIHTQFMEKTGIIGDYSILETTPDSLSKQIEMIRNNGYKGFNVTVPYKQKIIPLLDELDEHASQIGAVNTVVNKDGYLIGYNTDGTGYLRSLTRYYPNLKMDKTKRILIVGAGGAARGIYVALKSSGFHQIDFANRTIENAQSITEGHNKEMNTKILTLEQAEEHTNQYDIIIQTTNVGMKPNPDQKPISLHNIRKNTIVSDIIYQPIWTNFLQEALSYEAAIHHGHTMLLYQAQLAFELWFGIKPPLDQMDQELKQILEG